MHLHNVKATRSSSALEGLVDSCGILDAPLGLLARKQKGNSRLGTITVDLLVNYIKVASTPLVALGLPYCKC